MALIDPALAKLPRAVQLRLAAALLAASWERLWAALWLPVSVAAMIAAFALTDILPGLPGWLHVMVLVAALSGLGFVTARALRGFRWPTLETAKARLEADAAAAHRPLTTVQDLLAAAPTPAQQALWALHQSRAAASLAALRARLPAPGVAARDPRAIRAAAVIALFIAAAGSWGDMGPRLYRAAWPDWSETGAGVNVKVWITPPDYTGRSPMFVESPVAPGTQVPDALEVPERSKMLVVVTGTARETSVMIEDSVIPLEKVSDNSLRVEQEVPNGESLEVRQRARMLGAWRLKPVADLPPSVKFVREPREAGRWRLRLDYKAVDDYGIAAVTGRIVKPEQTADPNPDAESIEFDVTVPPFNPREAMQASLHDLTAHPWAGQKVIVQLIVTDQAGQSAPSEWAEVLLPERVFQHPVAKQIISVRKGLLTDPDNAAVAGFSVLSRILQAPQSFGGDPRTVLELATAKYRLAYEDAPAAAQSLPPILWAAAVRIEDGDLAVAEQRLDAAERALKEAMERGAPAEEISRLIEQLKRAVADYAKELASRMPESEMSLLRPEKGQRSVGPEDLAKMMDELRQMTQMGAKDAAQEMMAELQNMLQALRSAATNQRDNADVKKAQEIMRDLKSLTGEQSKLLEETFKQAREAQTGKQNSAQQKAQQRQSADQQEKLRRELGDLMGRMAEAAGQVPESMSGAEGAMRQARDALNAGAMKPATDSESEALAQLQDSMSEANEQLMQALEEKGLASMVPMPGDGESGNDPLGQRNGPDDDTQVDIPDAPDANSMAERVRAILEEIQRRAADRTRPADEQDYLRRLMKQF
jgi:uncharacterized protein (TIGR02302 family)